MHRLTLAAAVLLAGCAATSDGFVPDAPNSLSVTSPVLEHGQPVPAQYTCDGPNRSPPLDVTGIPAATDSVAGPFTLALIVDDPDATRGTFTHWLVWNVPVSGGVAHFAEATRPAGATEGANSADTVGWRGPCPPQGDGPHRYRFRAYVVDSRIDLASGAGRDALESALDGRVLAWGELVPTYDR